MAFNSSRMQDSLCSFLMQNASKSTSVYHQVIVITCVVSSFLAPMTVVGNALIMAAIWRNSSLRTPSYVLLAGLAFTDFCTGLISQPFYVLYNLARFAGNVKMLCITRLFTDGVAYYLSSLTVIAMTIIAIERWLHMSRRSLLTVRRVVIIYVTFVVLLIAFFAGRIYNWYYTKNYLGAFTVIFLLGALLCFALNIFTYFKVFRIIRHHQSQVQTNHCAFDIEKYKKSVFTILYILAIFLLSYAPYVCCLLAIRIMEHRATDSFWAALNVSATVVFSSSFVNPLLYYWRIKEIRESVRPMVRKICCKKN